MITKAELSAYSRYGSLGLWEIDVWFDDEPGRHIKTVGEHFLMDACGATRRGTFAKPRAFLKTREGMDWLENHLKVIP